MTEMMMLDLSAVDLEDLALALEDHSGDSSWYIHRLTGVVRLDSLYIDEEMDDAFEEDGNWVFVDPMPSRVAYEDMEDFVRRVSDPRAAGVLARAIEGRGAFRRFKDALFEFDELRKKWFAFHDLRVRRYGITWLLTEGLIDRSSAEVALAQLEDPVVGDGLVDVDELARCAADGLRALYGERLREVRLFGSRARGDAGADSDLDLLVVLDAVDAPFEELRRMDELLWELTEQSGITVSALPVSAASLDDPQSPTLIRAKAEAVTIR